MEVQAADWVIAQSRYTVDYLIRRGIGAGRIRVLPLGVDVGKFAPRSAKQANARPEMLFVGQVGYRKGIWQLLTQLDRTEFDHWNLRIVGEAVDSVGRWCAGIGLPNVRVYGRVPDEEVIRLYQAADVFVMPSLSEGGCNVVMEALACGTPCIVSDAAVSIVGHGESGYVVRRGDMAAFAGALALLRQNRGLRQMMARKARLEAEKHSWRDYRARLVEFYRSTGPGFDADGQSEDRPISAEANGGDS